MRYLRLHVFPAGHSPASSRFVFAMAFAMPFVIAPAALGLGWPVRFAARWCRLGITRGRVAARIPGVIKVRRRGSAVAIAVFARPGFGLRGGSRTIILRSGGLSLGPRFVAPGKTRRWQTLPRFFANWHGTQGLAGCLLHHRQSRPFVNDHPLRRRASDISRFALYIVNDRGPVEDRGVIDNDGGWPDAIREAGRFDEDKLRRPKVDRETPRRQRGPSDIAATDSPGYPGRAPFNSGDPHPGVGGIVSPPAIMVTSPAPRLVAGPIPAAIGPDPLAVTIGPPLQGDSRRTPAVSVTAHLHPGALGGQWRVKIGCRMDRDRGGNFQITSGLSGAQRSQQCYQTKTQACVHAVSFRSMATF